MARYRELREGLRFRLLWFRANGDSIVAFGLEG